MTVITAKKLTKEEQKEFFENFDIEPLTKIMTSLLGIDIELKKTLCYNARYDCHTLMIESQELVEHIGIARAIIKSIKADTFGTCRFFTNDEDEHELYIPYMHFSYVHTSGGTNGYELLNVSYDIRTGNWSYIENHKRVIAYDGQTKQYVNLPKQQGVL